MIFFKNIFFLLIILCTSCFELDGTHSHYPLHNSGDALDLSVLTFNILGTTDLGANIKGYPSWHRRRGAVFSILDDHNPDLITLQECSPTQFAEFKDRYADRYIVVHKLAHTPDAIILLKRERFELLEKGFWALEHAYEGKIPRIAVWAKVQEKTSKRELMFVGTHLDAKHFKIQEIHQIKDELQADQKSGAPLILAGDFNSTWDTEFYAPILEGGWKDSYLGTLEGDVKTFPLKNPTRRIDHVFYFGRDIESTHWERIDNKDFDLSDHFPVLVKFHISARKE